MIPIPTPIAVWHRTVETHDLAAFEALIEDDAVFKSPAVHSPQIGKAKVSTYLRAALSVLNNDTFRYVEEWYAENSAVLEFETTIDGIYMNGVDVIRWNAAGRVVEFKVMLRPLKGLSALIPLMAARLAPAAAP